MIGVLRAEWTKLRSVPSTGWLLLIVVLSMIGLALAITGTLRVDECGEDLCTLDTAKLSLSGVRLAQVGAGILGVLAATSEYTTGTITATLMAVPRRSTVVAAKVVVVGALVLAAAVLGVVGAVLVARWALPGRGFTELTGYPVPTLFHDLTQRAAVGTVLYLVLIALLGLGVGLTVRDTGGAVTIFLALLFVAPLIAAFVSDPRWQQRLHRFAPMDAGLAIQSTRDVAGLTVGPWPGLALLAGYASVAVLAGAAALRLRDA